MHLRPFLYTHTAGIHNILPVGKRPRHTDDILFYTGPDCRPVMFVQLFIQLFFQFLSSHYDHFFPDSRPRDRLLIFIVAKQFLIVNQKAL